MTSPSPHPQRDPQKEIQRLRTVVDELKLLNEIAMESSGARSLEEMLKSIIGRCLTVINAEQGSIVLVTGEHGTSLKTFLRQDNRSSLRQTYHVGTHIIGSVLYTREPLLIQDLATDTRFASTDEDRRDIHSLLCTPILNQGRLVGVFLMVNKKDGRFFTDDDLRLLLILSAQAGQLITNAQLGEEARRKQEELALARVEAEKWRELDQLKSHFFADISHEFRTPLTLILGPIERLIAGRQDESAQVDYQIIRRNAHRLLRLINDVLDLSRLEARSMKLRIAEGDVVPVIHTIVDSFLPLAEQSHIALGFSASPQELRGHFDREKMETVVYNLLSNALKFTPPEGNVEVSVTLAEREPGQASWACVTVADSGRGIPTDKLEHLFTRYFQVQDMDRQSGSGLGLALTKGLIDLLGGSITVTSNEDRGTTFSVHFPLEPPALATEDLAEVQSPVQHPGPGIPEGASERSSWPTAPSEAPSLQLPLLLIVEDDPDLRRYLCEGLKKSFRIYEASDGEIGLSIARDILPDIVVSDIRMPVMDGMQLCRSLKSDERTSHIPVLLLTAKASPDEKLAGLEIGADDYLNKPFSWEELVTRVHNLVESRKRLRERFSRVLPLVPSELGVSSMDEAFLTKVMNAIERSMARESFTVEDLAADVTMSYSNLHRKLTALVNQSPKQLIRSMRLQRAKELIERDAGTIAEIAYTVGFGSPAYLTKCFHEQFGIVPSQLKKKPAGTGDSL